MLSLHFTTIGQAKKGAAGAARKSSICISIYPLVN